MKLTHATQATLTQLQRNLQPLSANKRPVIGSTPPVRGSNWDQLCVCVCLSCFALVYECVSTLDLIKEPVIRPHSRKATTTTRLLTGLPSTRSLASGILLVHTQLIFSFLFFFSLSLSLSLLFFSIHPSFVVGRSRPSAQPGCRERRHERRW